VAAVAQNGVIGFEGAMPWRLREDLCWFKKNTMGKPVLMGRKTFQSIGKALPGRANIIITRDTEFVADGCLVFHDLDQAIEHACEIAMKDGAEEICVIGGGEIYTQTLAMADRLYLTQVMAELEGDTHFPDIDSARWSVEPHGHAAVDDQNSHECHFFVFHRKQEAC